MVFVSYRLNNLVKTCSWEEAKKSSIPVSAYIWVDVKNPSEEEKLAVQNDLEITFPTREELEEIESSARYSESDDEITANSSYLLQDPNGGFYNEPVSFIIREHLLVTYRNVDVKSFDETHKKIDQNTRAQFDGNQVFIWIFETRIDLDADLIESIARDISAISKSITVENKLDSDIILMVARYQETTMLLRQNIMEKQRIVQSVLRSDHFPKEHIEKIRILIKDIGSLLDHTTFSFDRLEYLQNTFLGLVNLEQNKIIKLFSVVTILFMPPTLIASIYGMNYDLWPHATWKYGFEFAIVLILLSSALTLMYFKRKKWL